MSDESILEIVIESADGEARYALPLSASSCWSSLLGDWPLPQRGALDAMDAFLNGRTPERITLCGCPSAAMLPLLWLRTIWFVDGGPELMIDWPDVRDPSADRGRQSAGKLACVLADQVACDDVASARRLWGVDPTHATGFADEMFDLVANMIDLWDSDLRHMTAASDWTEAMRRALVNCAALGQRRVGVYGAGTHTRAIGGAIMEPNVEIACVIDDDARRHGQRLWGFEIVSRERALEMKLDAVVISANSIEDMLWERAAIFRDAGVSVIRLYGGEDADGADAPIITATLNGRVAPELERTC